MIPLEQLVIDWAIERGILDQSTPEHQWVKTYEEMGELHLAILSADQPAIVDAIGDILVTLIIQAHMAGMDFTTCLHAAWQEIKDRKGTMVNGVFVKEEG